MAIDFYWTFDGDLSLGPDGDLRDTSFDRFRSLYQECRTRVRSSFKDWALHPSLGAGLEELIGKPNLPITAERGRTKIIAALTQGGFLSRNAIDVRYIPVGKQWISYSISVKVISPGTEGARTIRLSLLYDTTEGEVSVV
jgi:hypothetical protein